MLDHDLFAKLSSTEALDAWRAHEKAAHAAGRPLIVAGIVAAAADIALFVQALFANHFGEVAPVIVVLSVLSLAGWAGGQFLIARWRRDHPFDPDAGD